MNRKELEFLYHTSIIFIFVTTLLTILIGQILGITSVNDMVERKGIAPFPVVSLDNHNFISGLNQYFSDNFGFRNVLLKSYLFLKVNVFDSKKFGHNNYSDALMRNGVVSAWLDSNKSSQTLLYTENELAVWTAVLEKERQYLESQNIPYLVIYIPDRSVVLDPFDTRSIAAIRHRQFVDYVRKHSQIRLIDTTDSLIEARKRDDYPLFYKTDSHWTNYGAYIAYLDVIKQMRKFDSSLVPFIPQDFNIQTEKYDVWIGDMGFNYSANPNKPDYGVKFSFVDSAKNRLNKNGSILVYGDSFWDILRRICVPCVLERFPEVESVVPLLFTQPILDKADKDPNPGYWYAKYKIEQMIPIINENIGDNNLRDRFINYLMIQGLLPDRVGLDYFFRFHFNKVVFRDIESKIEQSLIDEYKPQFVIRDMVDPRIRRAFERLDCYYKLDSRFNGSDNIGSC